MSHARSNLRVDGSKSAGHQSEAALIVLDAPGIIREVSPAALLILRCSPRRLIGTRFVDMLDEGSRSKGEALLRAGQDGPTRPYEINHVADDGQVVLLSYQALPLAGDQDADGRGNGLLLLVHPLSETVATTERLVALNRRLHALFAITARASRSPRLRDLLQDVLSITLAELDLQAGAVFLTGLPATGDTATPHYEEQPLRLAAQQGFTSVWIERLAEPAAIYAFLKPSLTTEQAFTTHGSADELGLDPRDLQAATGPLLSFATTPLRSESGVYGWLVVLSDRYRAFEREEIETLRAIGDVLGPPIENAHFYEALHERGSQLQAVLEGIDSGVLLVDRAGIVRYANSRLGVLLHRDVSTWPGQPRTIVLGSYLAQFAHTMGAMEGELWEVSGPPRRILRRFTDDIADHTGTQLGAIEVYSDVTTLEEMNQLKDEFVAAAAHDLKTPVTAVKGYAQIALRLARRIDEPRLAQQLEMVNARSDELAMLMNSLLDLSRIQAGRLRLELDTFPLAEVVNRVIRHFEFDLQRHHRSIEVERPPTSIEVTWDRARIERVLINLIDNALKYSPAGGSILLSVTTTEAEGGSGAAVEMAVTDHGIGIPSEERERIFGRFYRVRQAIDDGFKGTGLGLYICMRVLEAHQGRIWAEEARHGGQGTTMRVVLPCRVTPAE